MYTSNFAVLSSFAPVTSYSIESPLALHVPQQVEQEVCQQSDGFEGSCAGVYHGCSYG